MPTTPTRHNRNRFPLRRPANRTSSNTLTAQLTAQVALLGDQLPAPIVISRRDDGTILYVNKEFARQQGVAAEQLIGRTSEGLYVNPNERSRLLAELARHGSVRNFEIQIKRYGDGSRIWISLAVEPLYIDDQALLCTMMEDITERKRRERELETVATLSAALRRAQTRSQMLPAILDLLIDRLDVDSAALVSFDPHSQEAIIELARGMLQPDSGARLPPGLGLIRRILMAGEVYITADIHTDLQVEGEYQKLFAAVQSAMAAPMRLHERLIGLLWVARSPNRPGESAFTPDDARLLSAVADMSAIALQRATLHDQIQQIMNTVADGLVLLDGSYRVVLANRVGREHLALLAGVSEGEQISTLADQPIAHLHDGHATPPPSQMENPPTIAHTLTVAEPRLRYFEILFQPLQPSEGIARWLMVSRDVTQPREVQHQLEMQARLAAVGQLAAGIAHDFNNILAVMTLYTDLLQQATNLTQVQRRQLQSIGQHADRAARLVQQILDFSRKGTLERAPVDLRDIVQEIGSRWKQTAPEMIRIVVEIESRDEVEPKGEADSYTMVGDRSRLQQALMNLAANALEAMPDGGVLKLRLTRLHLPIKEMTPMAGMEPGEWASLAVSDTGAGIAADVLPRVFEPFFTTKEPGQGAGLGLPQVFGIIQQHDGYLRLESEEGVGTTVTLYLPLAA